MALGNPSHIGQFSILSEGGKKVPATKGIHSLVLSLVCGRQRKSFLMANALSGKDRGNGPIEIKIPTCAISPSHRYLNSYILFDLP
jgi:hypothetical protein